MRIGRFVFVWLALALALFPNPVFAETLARTDGSEIIYHLKGSDGEAKRGLLLMLQGSGCEPVIERDWLRSEPAVLAPGRAVLTIEKYGVKDGPLSPGAIEGCSPEYWRKNTLSQRVMDAMQVVAQLRRDRWWNGELIIYGGSEGGAVAAMLAPLVPEAKVVVIVSSGIGVRVADLIRAAVPPPVGAQVPAIVAEAKANPSGNRQFGGASYSWWADAADVIPARALLQSNLPVLLVQGTRDSSAPVATARATQDMFIAAGKRNLTYREYEGYDHFMKDEAGLDHHGAVLRMIAHWIGSK